MKKLACLVLLSALSLTGCGALNQQLIEAAESYQSAKADDTRQVAAGAFKRLPDGSYAPFWNEAEQLRRFATDDDFQRAIIAAKTGK